MTKPFSESRELTKLEADHDRAVEAGLADLAFELRAKHRITHGAEPTANEVRAMLLAVAPSRGISREMVDQWFPQRDAKGNRI